MPPWIDGSVFLPMIHKWTSETTMNMIQGYLRSTRRVRDEYETRQWWEIEFHFNDFNPCFILDTLLVEQHPVIQMGWSISRRHLVGQANHGARVCGMWIWQDCIDGQTQVFLGSTDVEALDDWKLASNLWTSLSQQIVSYSCQDIYADPARLAQAIVSIDDQPCALWHWLGSHSTRCLANASLRFFVCQAA